MSTIPPKTSEERGEALARAGVNASNVLDRLSEELDVKTDTALAHKLNVSKTTISAWRSRNSIPYDHILYLSIIGFVDLNYVLLGTGRERKIKIPKIFDDLNFGDNSSVKIFTLSPIIKSKDKSKKDAEKSTIFIVSDMTFKKMYEESSRNVFALGDLLESVNFNKILDDVLADTEPTESGKFKGKG